MLLCAQLGFGQMVVENFDTSLGDAGYIALAFPVQYGENSSLDFYQETTDVFEGQAALGFEYSVEGAFDWGGAAGMQFYMLEDGVVWDFSGYESLSFALNNKVKSSQPGRTFFRVLLYDVSEDPDKVTSSEVWYSFLYVLDLEPGWNTYTVPLKDVGEMAQTNPGSGFWLSGFFGAKGNEKLDLDKIKRIGFQFDTTGPQDNSIAEGTLLLDNLMLVGSETGVETGKAIPADFELEQNYPNPFNPTTTIRYELSQNKDVDLIVLNSVGQTVNVLVDDYQAAGQYDINFDASDLSSGTYFYQLRAGNQTQIRPMTLLR
jgi:hypothetical protein